MGSVDLLLESSPDCLATGNLVVLAVSSADALFSGAGLDGFSVALSWDKTQLTLESWSRDARYPVTSPDISDDQGLVVSARVSGNAVSLDQPLVRFVFTKEAPGCVSVDLTHRTGLISGGASVKGILRSIVVCPCPTPTAIPLPTVVPPMPTPVVQEGTPTGTPRPIVSPDELPHTGGSTPENVVISPDVVRQILGNQVNPDAYQLVDVKNGEEKTFTTPTGYVTLTVTSETSESGHAVYRWIMVIWNDVTKIWETVTSEITTTTLRSRIADGGPYDMDGVVNGIVQSRTAIALLAAPKAAPAPTTFPRSSSGGGCSTGLLPGAVLLLVPFVFFLKR
ncbi:MAG: hypothetical protein BWY88_00720 [Synergistetes bacterium ADurb.Bin520]|nr:MAG: hypothetical protein BWY88_00720 [Synergistetes bacterium ADurb.Bin520]